MCSEGKQLELDKRYIRIAFIWSENSYAIRRKVGAIIVKDKAIISDGYNGTPAGFKNICEDVKCNCPSKYCNKITFIKQDKDQANISLCKGCEYAELITKPEVIHAEANAITKLAKSHNSSEGSTLYITDEPCSECSKLIIQSGIIRVVYCREYTKHDGIELLKKDNIQVDRIELQP